MKLYIGNKNYSSWSLRPWLVLKEAGIPFEEIALVLDPEPGSTFKQKVSAVTGGLYAKVPVLVTDEGAIVWDSLAICETIADRFPDKGLWPQDRSQRARARSLCAEMHSGFTALRSHLPFNIEASLPGIGQQALAGHADVAADVQRLDELWSRQLSESGGPFLFGRFSIADAFFAPVCTRFRTYDIGLSTPSSLYASRVLGLPGMQAWTWEALAAGQFLKTYEPYRDSR